MSAGMVAMSLANGLLWGLGLMKAWLMKVVVAAAADWLEVWNGVAESIKQRRDALLEWFCAMKSDQMLRVSAD